MLFVVACSEWFSLNSPESLNGLFPIPQPEIQENTKINTWSHKNK